MFLQNPKNSHIGVYIFFLVWSVLISYFIFSNMNSSSFVLHRCLFSFHFMTGSVKVQYRHLLCWSVSRMKCYWRRVIYAIIACVVLTVMFIVKISILQHPYTRCWRKCKRNHQRRLSSTYKIESGRKQNHSVWMAPKFFFVLVFAVNVLTICKHVFIIWQCIGRLSSHWFWPRTWPGMARFWTRSSIKWTILTSPMRSMWLAYVSYTLSAKTTS